MNRQALPVGSALAVVLAAGLANPATADENERPRRFVAWQDRDTLVTVASGQAATWDATTGKQRRSLRLTAAPHVLAESPVSPDGKRLFVEAEPKSGVGRVVPLGDGKEV